MNEDTQLSGGAALRYGEAASVLLRHGRPLSDRSSTIRPAMTDSGAHAPDASAIQALIRPESIAVIGATADANKLNGRPLHYLRRDGYRGRIYPVNPNREDVIGFKCYPDVESLPEAPQMAIVAVAARRAVAAVEALGRKGTRTAIVFSAGFGETGEEGRRLERRLLDAARETGIRVCGPNNLGVVNAFDGVTATFSQYAFEPPVTGPVAFASQSGALGTGIAALARSRGIGFGYFVNTGNEADITSTEALEHLLDDDRIEVAAAYLEGLKDPESLLRLADKAVRIGKPLVLTKVGRKAAGARAAASHTGALAGEDAVFDGIARQYGIVRARNEEHMLDLVSAFTACAPPRGPRIAIVTQSGGAAALMADRAEELGLEVPVLGEDTQARLRATIPPFGISKNPVDLTAQFIADPDVLSKSVKIALADPGIDGAVIWFQLMHAFADELIDALLELKRSARKPFVVCWLAAPEAAVTRLRGEGVFVIGATERAIDAIAGLRAYGEARRRPRRTTRPVIGAARPDGTGAVRPLPTVAARRLLSDAGIPLVDAELAADADAAAAVAARLGLPAAVKIESPDIPHKSEAGGVRLGLASTAEVKAAADDVFAAAARDRGDVRIDGVVVQPMAAPGTELVMGVRRDPVFGPVAMLGLGGVFVETLKDVAFARAPLMREDVPSMIESLKGQAVLRGARGRPAVDVESLTDLLVALSRFAVDRPEIAEVDLNPVVAGPDGLTAVDWLILSTEPRRADGTPREEG